MDGSQVLLEGDEMEHTDDTEEDESIPPPGPSIPSIPTPKITTTSTLSTLRCLLSPKIGPKHFLNLANEDEILEEELAKFSMRKTGDHFLLSRHPVCLYE